MSNILIRQSQIENSMGGDISYRNLHLFDDTLVIELTPEESFFSTEVYKGLYIQNITKDILSPVFISGDVKDISIISIGGIGSIKTGQLNNNMYYIDDKIVESFIFEAADNQVELIDNSRRGIIRNDDPDYDTTKLTFYDWLYARYKTNIPPYNPSAETLDGVDADYEGKSDGLYPERQEFENLKLWFSINVLIPASMRSSLFGQLKTEVYIPSERVLNPIDDTTELLSFDRKSKNLSYLDAYKARDVGSYWGFYLKITVDFIPDWGISSDSSTLVFKWTDSNNEEHSKIIKIVVNGNVGDINTFNKLNMESLYDNYPPYFRYYEDI